MNAFRVSDKICKVNLPPELTNHDETPLLLACGPIGDTDKTYIFLDFTSVEKVNGLGASMLAKLATRARRRGQRIIAYGLNEHYRDVFRITDLDRDIQIFDSEGEALSAIGTRGALRISLSRGEAKKIVSRDKDSWAKYIPRMKVTEVPPGAVSLNVDGRRAAGPFSGFGQMWQKAYRQSLAGTNLTPVQAISVMKENFINFQPPQNRFYPSRGGIRPGEVVLINSSTPGGSVYTGVLVLYADDVSFTFITPQGHPESGWVNFNAFEEDGHTVVQIIGFARASDPVYEAAFRFVGSKLQESIWRHVLSSMATHIGVKPEIDVKKSCIDHKLQWSKLYNVWYNAQIRSIMYRVTTPFRRNRK